MIKKYMIVVVALLTAFNFCAKEKKIDYFDQVLKQCKSDECRKMVDLMRHAPRINASVMHDAITLSAANNKKQGISDESIAKFYKKETGKEYTKESREQDLAKISESYANLLGMSKDGGFTTIEGGVNAQRTLIESLKTAGLNPKKFLSRVVRSAMAVDPDDQKAALAAAVFTYHQLYLGCFESVGVTLPSEL